MVLVSFFLSLLFIVQAQYPPWPLENTVGIAQQFASSIPLPKSTGLTKKDYLDTISGIVTHFRAQQIANGSIIDKYAQEEIQYSTPCYSHAAATLIAYNYTNDYAGLLESAALAFDCSAQELNTATCAQGHCAFYTMPLILAYRILAPLVNSTRQQNWYRLLSTLNPAVVYNGYPTNNWGVVALSGEYLRTHDGLNPNNNSWWTTELDMQMSPSLDTCCTANGQYQDHSGSNGLNPIPYDHFPRHYFSLMLQEGYKGNWSDLLWEYNRRAAWVSLLMQSPQGEMPTGGRSSQHQWNEAVSTVTYELWATLLQHSGQPNLACMMKRGAHLSLQSVRRWQQSTGELLIVKNRYDPALRYGYEDYSYQAQYNLLPASMLSMAIMYMDDDIPECTAPADAGGFAFELPEYHLVIGNAGGVYTEIETGADPNYDSTGITRVHVSSLKGTQINPLIGPTAASAQKDGGLAFGPFWQKKGVSTIDSLANCTYADDTKIVFDLLDTGNSSYIKFEIEYTLQMKGVVVIETYTLTDAKVSVFSQVIDMTNSGFTSMGIRAPLFLYDGQNNVTTGVKTSSSTSGYAFMSFPSWGTQNFTVSATVSLSWEEASFTTPSRNGVLQMVSVTAKPSTTEPSLTYEIIPSM